MATKGSDGMERGVRGRSDGRRAGDHVRAVRAFVVRPRCIYSGDFLDPDDPELKPGPEHIVPLALGGTNGFVTHDVSRRANNWAGNEIDDALASLFTVTLLRNRFGLAGHRGVVPDVRIDGRFDDMTSTPDASMIVEANASVRFDIKGTQAASGGSLNVAGNEEWVKRILGYRLRQAKAHGGHLKTQLGDISDEDDIEVALALADRQSGRQFVGTLKIDLRAHQRALRRFVTKVALCVGHRVLGAEWTFGPDGNRLRRAVFPAEGAAPPSVRGTLYADLERPVRAMLDLAPDRHSIAFLRFGDTALVLVALFGGDLGIAAVGLSSSAKRYRSGRLRTEPEGQLFQLGDFAAAGKPKMTANSLDQMVLKVSPFF